MKKIIEVSNLTKEYKNKKAVDNLSFDLYEGEILGLLGPNESGKSTTINCLLSLLKYQKGSRNNILDDIKKLRDDGATIIYTTHYMEEVEILGDRIIILDKGKITAQGTSENIKSFFERVYAFLDELKTKKYEQVLIVAHSGVSKAFSGYFEGIKDGKFLNRGLKNCEIKMYEM